MAKFLFSKKKKKTKKEFCPVQLDSAPGFAVVVACAVKFLPISPLGSVVD